MLAKNLTYMAIDLEVPLKWKLAIATMGKNKYSL